VALIGSCWGIFTGVPAELVACINEQDHSTFWANLLWSLFQKEKKWRFLSDISLINL
jgi:hypothetical protein